MKTRIAILMAFVMALAIVGALYATNRTAEAGEIRQIDVQAGTAVSLVISTDSSTCNAAVLPSSRGSAGSTSAKV